jgi:hypothetical protein
MPPKNPQKVIDPKSIFDKRMFYQPGFKQIVYRKDLSRYINKYGRDIDFIIKPSWWKFWTWSIKKLPLVDKNLGYGNIEVSVYNRKYRTHNSIDEKIRSVSDDEEI